jgi:hypothetical protein
MQTFIRRLAITVVVLAVALGAVSVAAAGGPGGNLGAHQGSNRISAT